MKSTTEANPVRTVGSMLCCLVLSACIGTLLLCGAYSLPTGPIDENVRKSAETFREEGTYHTLFSWCTSMLDNFTDAYMLLEAADPSGGSVLEKALTNRPGISGRDPRQVLTDHYLEGEPVPSVGYPRYWHGYQVWLKPLLSVLTYNGIRIVNAVFQLALVILTCLLLYRKQLKRVILPFLLTWLMLMPVALAESLQFSACFDVSVLAVIALLAGKRDRSAYFFLFAGIATAFFDLLTYPGLTFGLPAAVYFALYPGKNAKDDLKRLARTGLCWGLGYLGMWALKWAAASLFTGQDVFADAMSQIRVRTSDLGQDDITHVSLLECIFRNILWFVQTPATILTGLYCVWNCLPFSIRKPGKSISEKQAPKIRLLPYLAIALLPLAWFAVTVNHSYMHIFYVNKTLAMSVFALTVWMTGLYARIKGVQSKKLAC